MPLDASILQRTDPTIEVVVERGRIQQFSKAIGEQDPIYSDVAAARAAGHPDLPAPPTFLFGLELECSDIFDVLGEYGVDLGQVLHGEQTFRYFEPVHAGDTVVFAPSYVDLYSKAGGSLDFLIRRCEVLREGTKVAEMESTTVVKNGGIAS
ncbi:MULTISPECIES: MaoC family dehydratase N-terminal domain-containing protein [Rhodococcus]|uniref:MaoC family dehydratase N-terminal domain-containing protein n=1 Tax=Rhodococcus TaxID=1827 RepID=UPI00082C06B7|nr:MaoC family dehydratase N-terminal domain-containing protein [Rhodococcus phenolicus]